MTVVILSMVTLSLSTGTTLLVMSSQACPTHCIAPVRLTQKTPSSTKSVLSLPVMLETMMKLLSSTLTLTSPPHANTAPSSSLTPRDSTSIRKMLPPLRRPLATGSEDFSCKLYSDAGYNNQLTESSIANMGSNIYGLVESQTTLPGVKYNLVDFIVSDGNDNADADHVFKVIDNGVTSELVNAASDGSASTGSSLAFSYWSFGFENLDNQNDLDNKCVITLSLE